MLCDTWSVGIITYYLLSGGLPFDGMQDIVVKRRIRTEQAKFRDEEWSLLSQEALRFTQVMLNKCPALRPTAAAALDHIWFSLDVEANGVKIGEFGPYATSLSILSRKKGTRQRRNRLATDFVSIVCKLRVWRCPCQ